MDTANTANTPATRPGPALGSERKPFMGLNVLDNLSQLPMLRQFALLIGLAASVAIGFAVVLWSQEPDYQTLYSNMENYDSAQVVDILTQRRIKYRVDPNNGALLVATSDLADARMSLASAGVTARDNNLGYEILDREQGLGTSQFMETTRYRRGLEGEMARTISSLYNIKSARVHIAMPRSTVFVRDDRKPSASVLLEMYAGRNLEPAQVMAIVNLVATSVPELSKDQVTIVDQNGNLLSDQNELSELTVALLAAYITFCSRLSALAATRQKCRRMSTSVRWNPLQRCTALSRRCAANRSCRKSVLLAKARKAFPVH